MLAPGPSANDTVTLIDLAGGVHARATFAPRAIPSLGANTLLQPEARVANGRVFYIDGGGTVRVLPAGGGSPTEVASFPITGSRSEVSFAVSPDGARLMASVLVLAPDSPTGTLSLQSASAGGTTTTLYQKSFSGPTLQVVDWDATGPVAIPDQPLATQFGNPGRGWLGHGTYLSAAGTPGSSIGGPNCYAWAAPRAGRVVCTDQLNSGPVTIRETGGGVVFTVSTAAADGSFALSPDGTRLAYATPVYRTAAELLWDAFVVDEKGARVRLANDFAPQGWIDSTRLVGVTFPNGSTGTGSAREQPGNLALVDIQAPTVLHDLGLNGSLVGVIS